MARGDQTPLPSPVRRNWVWSSIQFLLRNFFTVWLGYRAKGFEKLPRSTGALLLINHQSFLDPLLVGLPLQRPISYLARHSLFPVPIVGWILRNAYVMPINQETPTASSIRESIRRMEHGFLVGIFPEGSRTRDGSVAAFEPGFGMLIRRTRVPVYPVGVAGAFESFPIGTCVIKPGCVRVVFGDPLPESELERLTVRGRESELAEFARQRVLDCQRRAEQWRQRALLQTG